MKRVLLIEDLPQVAQHLQSMLTREKEIEIAGVQGDADAAIAQVATEKPDVVMIDSLIQGKTPAMDIAKKVRAASPGTRIIMVTVPQKPLDAKAEAAIDAVFVLPGGANELAEVLGVGKAARPQNGQMIAIYSPKGGTGKTTLAVNLACVLRRQGKSVALMDGVMQFGAVRHVMQVPAATRSFVDLRPPALCARRSPKCLGGSVRRARTTCRPSRRRSISSGERHRQAMNMLAESHDYVIVDTPSRLTEDAVAILDTANVILMVVTYMNATVANSRSAIDTFEALGYKGRKPILLVVNQSDTPGGMSKTAVEHALNLPIIARSRPTGKR